MILKGSTFIARFTLPLFFIFGGTVDRFRKWITSKAVDLAIRSFRDFLKRKFDLTTENAVDWTMFAVLYVVLMLLSWMDHGLTVFQALFLCPLTAFSLTILSKWAILWREEVNRNPLNELDKMLEDDDDF
jgi:hypothetical protein